MKMPTIIIFLIILIITNHLAYAFSLKPCAMKEKMDKMSLPPETPVAMVAGHQFRKADICIPIEIQMRWENHYRGGHHSQYDMKSTEIYPGEFWYRVDGEEFVLVANGKNYSGTDKLIGFSASGEGCHNSYEEVCNDYTSYSSSHAKPKDIMGSRTGSFQYTFPTVITKGSDVPEMIYITPGLFKFKKGENYANPPVPVITNLDVLDNNPFLYKDLIKKARLKKPYIKDIKWKNNEEVENQPTKHRGKLNIRISFNPKCPDSFRIITPKLDQKFVFSEAKTGEVIIDAEAGGFGNFPPDLMDEIEWTAQSKEGSQVIYQPVSRKGKTIRIVYRGLPSKNSEFGDTTIKASVHINDECGTVEYTTKVKLFFPRDGKNNPTGDLPNWYFYWLQTPAGHGAKNGQQVLYMDRKKECGENPRWLGYHPRVTNYINPGNNQSQPLLVGLNHIYICDFHKYDNFYADNPSTNFYMKGLVNPGANWEGIDTFAVIMKHELTHMHHWMNWWNPTGGYPKKGFYDKNFNNQRDADEPLLDSDEDFMPDSVESGLGYDVGVRNTYDAPGGSDMHDEHHLTYDLAEKWLKGSADNVDWAKPGKQWK